MLRGAPLVEAEERLRKRSEDVSAAEQDFIKKGLELRDRQRQEEEKRRQRELEAARQLAEESQARSKAEEEARQYAEQRAEEQARARRLAQTWNVFAIMATTFVGLAAIFAFIQWNKAHLQSQNFRIRAESANASAILELDGLISTIKVGKELRKLQQSGKAENSTGIEVLKGLQQVVDNVREKNRLTGHSDEVNSVSFSPDGRTIATASADRTVKLWWRDGSLIANLTDHGDQVLGVAFSPDGQTITTASADKTVKLWRRNGSLIDTLTGHSDDVQAVSFSPDGQTIATASADKTVKLWRVVDGSLLITFKGHDDKVLGG